MRKSFTYRDGQRHLNYKGKDIVIDADEFDMMSDDEIDQIIKNHTQEDVFLSPDEAEEGFSNMRKQLGMPPYDPNKEGTFKKFIKGRLRDV
jgi:hypothetical protein